MDDYSRSPGKTTIAPEVLVSIAQLTTLSVPGVSRLSPVPSVNKIFNKGTNDGVEIIVENNTVYADLYVVIKGNTNVKDVSHAIQDQVARAISEMVGMEVGRVNIHVEDIDYTSEVKKVEL